jgi:PIN domain nuclease of toxin-antitoxin system
MKLLLDTHILLWFLEGNASKISSSALRSIQAKENEKFVSIASLWEVAIKVSIGKLPIQSTLSKFFDLVSYNGFEIVSLNQDHILEYLRLPLLHRDPFDRILIAQSSHEGFQIVTKDPNFSLYPIKIIW